MTKLAVVVQRYGADINGGAELHARYIAERLARHANVEVLTTCAKDYVSWRNELPSGAETVNGVTVRRFPVTRERDPHDFGTWSKHVFDRAHSLREELRWLDAEGPTSPALVSYLRERQQDYDFFIFFSARYYHTYHGIRAVGRKAILVPTLERDGALGLGLFPPMFRSAGAIMYNSYEERALIHAVARNEDVPSVVVGVGSEIPSHVDPRRFRSQFGIDGRFAIYIGRIDENKGCAELFDFFKRYVQATADDLHLVLIGNPIIPIPQHPRIHHLGFVGDQAKFDALSAASLLIMPSYLESLSMVALEAWALGVPVLANGKCDVLKGQCLRSNGGLYYDNVAEFLGALHAMSDNPMLASALGASGREYFRRHYTWPIIERKYLDMIDRLTREPRTVAVEPLPGWFSRWRKNLPPAQPIVDALPTGPVAQIKEERVVTPAPATKPNVERERPRSTTPAKPVQATAADRRGDDRRSDDRRQDSSRRFRGRGGRGGDRRARPPRRSNGR